LTFDPYALEIEENDGTPTSAGPIVPVFSMPVAPSAAVDITPDPEDHPNRRRHLHQVQRAAFYFHMGETQERIAELLGKCRDTIQRWKKTQDFKDALAGYQVPAETRTKMLRETLAMRQIDYYEEMDALATDPNVPAHTRADVLKDLLNRDRTIPTLGKHVESDSGGLVISESALEKLGRAIGEGLRRDSERAFTVDVERLP
jgi:hypothetical protein